MASDEMRLSEKIADEVEDIAEWPSEPRIKHQHEEWASQARALEERVEAAEAENTRQRNEFNSIWSSNQEQLDAAYADAAQANERINELIQEKKEGWALAYEKNNQLRNAERRAIADGAHIASLQEENARLRKVVGWAPDKKEFADLQRECNRIESERDELSAKIAAVAKQLELYDGQDSGTVADRRLEYIGDVLYGCEESNEA